MKILYLITKAERGGAQTHLWTLMRLQAFGTPCLVLGEDGFLADQARHEGVPVHVLSHFAHPIHPWRDLLAVGALIGLIRRERPGLIHAHTAKAGMLARIAGFLTGTPTVYTVHAWSFTAIDSPPLRLLSMWVERGLSLLNQMVIEVSEANFRLAEKKALAPPRNHLVIWNGVPDTPRRARPGAAGPVRITMVARFAPPKDHALLVEALAQLPPELRNGWECSLVGSGPGQARIEAQVRACGLESNFRFCGDRDDVPELLAASHLFALCSKSESLPISILEAMRAGLPVISSAVGGCGELVQDGVTGILTAPGNRDALRDALARLISSAALREAFGSAGRARFEADFRVEGMIQQTVAAYSRLRPPALAGASAPS